MFARLNISAGAERNCAMYCHCWRLPAIQGMDSLFTHLKAEREALQTLVGHSLQLVCPGMLQSGACLAVLLPVPVVLMFGRLPLYCDLGAVVGWLYAALMSHAQK